MLLTYLIYGHMCAFNILTYSIKMRFAILAHVAQVAMPTAPHLVSKFDDCIADYVKFVPESVFRILTIPLPRCQDIDVDCRLPTADDLVVANSHAWPYQVHPDPLGEKVHVISNLLMQATAVYRPLGETLTFLDFISVNQRPRTESEDISFMAALAAMPFIYMSGAFVECVSTCVE